MGLNGVPYRKHQPSNHKVQKNHRKNHRTHAKHTPSQHGKNAHEHTPQGNKPNMPKGKKETTNLKETNNHPNDIRPRTTPNEECSKNKIEYTAGIKIKKRLFQEGKERPTAINLQTGINTISVVSFSPDHFATTEVQSDITQQLLRRKIHIAMIQETHIPRNSEYTWGEYRIITSAAIRNPKNKTRPTNYWSTHRGGVAIAIHQELAPQISHIERINHRILKVTLDHQDAHTHARSLY